MATRLDPQQIKRAGLNNANGKPSRLDRKAIAIVNAAIGLGLLEESAAAPRGQATGLYVHEIEYAAIAAGHKTSGDVQRRVSLAATRLTVDGGFARTTLANERALAFMSAAEDLEPDGEDPEALAPLLGITVDDATLNNIAEHYESFMMFNAERLNALDRRRACRRIVRGIIQIAGGSTSVPFRFGVPLEWRSTCLAGTRVGTNAVDIATDVLMMRIDKHAGHTAAMERFWQVSRTVLMALGAAVTMDVDRVFRADAPDHAVAS